jgi:hypothetical protein
MRFRIGVLTLAFALAGAPVAAADHLDCMDSGYTEEQAAELDRFTSNYPNEIGENFFSPEMTTAIDRRARVCSAALLWQQPAIEQAVTYKLTGLLRQALERNPRLDKEQLARLRAAVEKADQHLLRKEISQVFNFAGDTDDVPSAAPGAPIVLALIERSGAKMTRKTAEFAAHWVAAKVLQDMAVERFAAAK